MWISIDVTLHPVRTVRAGIRQLCVLFLLFAIVSAVAQENPAAEKFRQGTEAFRNGQLSEADNDFSQVARLEPRFAEVYMNLALVQEREGKIADEIHSLQTALRLKPAMRGANLFLGIAYYRQDNFTKARAALEREVRENPTDPKALMWLGIVDDATGDPMAAVDVLNKATRLSPNDVDILYNRGRAAMLLSQTSYEKMFKINPDSWRVHQVLGEAFAESDRHAQAIAEYKSAIQQAPDEPALYSSLGDEYYMESQLDLARQAYTKELELDPENPRALYHVGAVDVDQNQSSQGVPLLEKALALDPGIADAAYHLGRGDMDLGQDQAAVDNFKHAITLDPKGDLAQRSYYQLAQVYRRMHLADQSHAALQQYMQLKSQADAARARTLDEVKKRHEKDDSEAAQPVGNK